MIVSYCIIYANHFDRPVIKVTMLKISNFSIATSICPKYYCTQLSCVKKEFWRNLASMNLKLKT